MSEERLSVLDKRLRQANALQELNIKTYAKESKEAMKKVKELLDETGPFGDGRFFQNRRGAEFFLRLTDAAPDAALRRLERTVGTWTIDQLRDFKEGRREVVWALERIAVWQSLFQGAARLLLRLAE